MDDKPIVYDKLEDNDRRRALLAVIASLGVPAAVLAQDAAVVQPRAYRVAFENDKLRVLEFNSRPGMAVCGNGMHSHPAHLTVQVSAAKVRVKHPDGKIEIAEFKPGEVLWFEAETHEVENISGKDMRALLVELKSPARATS
jgi:hypothetical protein